MSPEIIIASPRSESLFYVRVENPEIKIGYIPRRIKIAHGIYLGDIIIENVSGKAYLNVISVGQKSRSSSADFASKPLDELTIKMQDNRTEITDIQINFTDPNHQEHNEIFNCSKEI